VVIEASGLVATGEDQQLITEALGEELLRALELGSCELHAEPPTGSRPTVSRDGSLVGLFRTETSSPPQIDLPVWSQGEVVAHYRLTLGPKRPSRQELRVALSLADQAGAAMANAGHHPPPPRGQAAPLRLLPSTATTSSSDTEVPRHDGSNMTFKESPLRAAARS
jgi:hypothetical protein